MECRARERLENYFHTNARSNDPTAAVEMKHAAELGPSPSVPSSKRYFLSSIRYLLSQDRKYYFWGCRWATIRAIRSQSIKK